MKQISTKEIVESVCLQQGFCGFGRETPPARQRPIQGELLGGELCHRRAGSDHQARLPAAQIWLCVSKISTEIPNFVQCDAAVLYDRRVLVIYPNGEAGIFDREGTLEWNGMFQYHDAR